MRVVKASVDVERQKLKRRSSSQVVSAGFVKETLRPYLESSESYKKIVCQGLSAHSLLKLNLVKGLASFHFCVLFLIPKEQAASSYGCLFNSFSDRGGVARELRTLHLGKFID